MNYIYIYIYIFFNQLVHKLRTKQAFSIKSIIKQQLKFNGHNLLLAKFPSISIGWTHTCGTVAITYTTVLTLRITCTTTRATPVHVRIIFSRVADTLARIIPELIEFIRGCYTSETKIQCNLQITIFYIFIVL